jgi:hypothetical protein
MKTLEELGLEYHKTGNYADYFNRPDRSLVCCGLMEVHEDSDSIGDSEDPIFKVEPLYWEKDVVFIYKPRIRWCFFSKEDFLIQKKVSGIKFSNKAFHFDGRRYHGLVPKSIANRLNTKDYLMSEEYLTFKESCRKKITPKLVWKWQK